MATKDMKLAELARRAHDEIADYGAALERASALFRALKRDICGDGPSTPDQILLIEAAIEMTTVYAERAEGELGYFEAMFANREVSGG